MENKNNIILIGIIIVSAILSIILIIFGIMKLTAKKPEKLESVSYGSAGDKNIIQTEDRYNNVIENSIIGENYLQNKDKIRFDKKNYTELAKYQFSPIKEGEEYLEITLETGKKLKAKLFEKVLPETVKEIKNKVDEGGFVDFKMFKANGSGDYISPHTVPRLVIKKDTTYEMNTSLVPYKGAILLTGMKKYGEKDYYGTLGIVTSSNMPDDPLFIKRGGYNATLETEKNNRGGNIRDHYLKSPVVGQIVEGLDELNEEVKRTSSPEYTKNYPGIYIDVTIKSMEIKKK